MYADEQQAPSAVLVSPADWVMPERPSVISTTLRFIRRKPLGAFGFLMVFLVVAATLGTPQAEFGRPKLPDSPLGFELGSPWMARYSPEEVFRDPLTGSSRRFETPSAAHWFGTDENGRDTYSRLIWGARRSMFIGLWALTFATVVGTAIGVTSAYFRGWLDTFTQRFMDSFQAFPALLLLLFLLSLFRPDLTILALGLGFVGVTSIQRIVRSVVLSAREQPYVEAARVLGATDLRTIVFHILPNIAAPIIVVFSIGLGAVIVAEAGVSFIAERYVPQGPSWGIMLSRTRQFFPPDPEGWHTVAAGSAIALAVLGFNLAGDALRDVLDPRLRLG